MNSRRPVIIGVVNITPDSFSDGGLYLEPEKAILHARRLIEEGANVVELGAASSHPDSVYVSPEEELRRLQPVLDRLMSEGLPLAVDTTQIDVQRYVLEKNVQCLNDIRGFPDSRIYVNLADSDCKLIVMHSITHGTQAQRIAKDPAEVLRSIHGFFRDRIDRLISAGIYRSRIILDPGMGFFLSSNPETSFAVLTELAALKRDFELPLMVCVSRKSFLRNFKPDPNCDIGSRTLAAELFAAKEGVDYIRTHDVRALAQALDTIHAIEDARSLL